MNYYQARELRDADGKGTGLWHYTVRNDDRIWATGYCSPWETCPACKGNAGLFAAIRGERCATCEDKGIVRRADPCPGHDTPEGAREHYRQYLLDQVRYDQKLLDERRKCAVCGAWSEYTAFIPSEINHVWVLCDEHRNREQVDKLLKAPEASISSW